MSWSDFSLLSLLACGLAFLALVLGLFSLIWLIFEQRNWTKKKDSLLLKPRPKSSASDPVEVLRAKGL